MAIPLPSTVAVFQLVLSYYVLELIYHKRCCLVGVHIGSPSVSTLLILLDFDFFGLLFLVQNLRSDYWE